MATSNKPQGEKLAAAKAYLGERYCLHPAHSPQKRPDAPEPFWRKVARYLEGERLAKQAERLGL